MRLDQARWGQQDEGCSGTTHADCRPVFATGACIASLATPRASAIALQRGCPRCAQSGLARQVRGSSARSPSFSHLVGSSDSICAVCSSVKSCTQIFVLSRTASVQCASPCSHACRFLFLAGQRLCSVLCCGVLPAETFMPVFAPGL